MAHAEGRAENVGGRGDVTQTNGTFTPPGARRGTSTGWRRVLPRASRSSACGTASTARARAERSRAAWRSIERDAAARHDHVQVRMMRHRRSPTRIANGVVRRSLLISTRCGGSRTAFSIAQRFAPSLTGSPEAFAIRNEGSDWNWTADSENLFELLDDLPNGTGWPIGRKLFLQLDQTDIGRSKTVG